MKKSIITILVFIFLSNYSYAQNYVPVKFIIPQSQAFISLKKIERSQAAPAFNRFVFSPAEFEKQSFISSLPVINLKEFSGRRSVSFFSELSLNDLLENTMTAIDPAFINKYDDHIDELFKDAPSLVKFNCVIKFR